MSKLEKLIKRFISKPKDFTYQELMNLLNSLGYSEIKTGNTSGSRVAFYNTESKHIIRLHKPHPSNVLKRYQLDYLEDELKNAGAIQ